MTRTTSAEKTRKELLVEHVAARERRDAAALGSAAFRNAADEVARIEVEIARIERAMTPPRG
jgi:hypothetical protein